VTEPRRGAVVVFAKRPEAGQVKTRLCPPLRPEEAAALYACMLDDVLEATARAASQLGLAAILAVHPPEARDALAARAPAAFRVIPQRGADLAERMEAAVADASGLGFAPLLLRGSDSPALAAELLGEALAALGREDLVLSPAADGGYDLVGVRAPTPGLFRHAMSTDSVMADTLRNARALGLRTALLSPSFDVDVVEDLHELARVRAQGRATACPRTLAWLDAHGAWPRG
jgi:rSAM/selenodomain-associated transferase 1